MTWARVASAKCHLHASYHCLPKALYLSTLSTPDLPPITLPRHVVSCSCQPIEEQGRQPKIRKSQPGLKGMCIHFVCSYPALDQQNSMTGNEDTKHLRRSPSPWSDHGNALTRVCDCGRSTSTLRRLRVIAACDDCKIFKSFQSEPMSHTSAGSRSKK